MGCIKRLLYFVLVSFIFFICSYNVYADDAIYSDIKMYARERHVPSLIDIAQGTYDQGLSDDCNKNSEVRPVVEQFDPSAALSSAYVASDISDLTSDNIYENEPKVIINTADYDPALNYGALNSDKGALSGHTLASSLLNMSDADIVEMIGPMMTENQRQTGIPASMAMAQFIVESGFGKAELPQNANNIFGMKTELSGNTWPNSYWDGESIYTKATGEQAADGAYYSVVADFRAYDCIEDCIRDYSSYLLGAMKNGKLRYPGISECHSYEDGIEIVKNGGYCTSQSYINKIYDRVNIWDLTRFDLGNSNKVTSENTEVSSNNDKSGILIAIDAGHQRKGNNEKEPLGPGSSEMKAKVSGGTKGVSTGLPEYELTLQVAEKLQHKLEAEGYQALMIRDSNDVNISNAERAEKANEANADAFIRLHANGSDDSSVNGVLTICQTASNKWNGNLHDKSYELSKYILEGVVSETGAKKERVWETDTMTGINWCNVPVTILEMGYMTNPVEDKNMSDSNYQDKIVSGILQGFNNYFGKR